MTIDELEAKNTEAALREGPVTYALLMNARRTRVFIGEPDLAAFIEEAKLTRPNFGPLLTVGRQRTAKGTFVPRPKPDHHASGT